MTTPISLVVDDNPPIYYLARITSIYCCNCRTSVDVSEPFTVHTVGTVTHKRPIKNHNSDQPYYNLPIRTERAQPIPVPFCSECPSDAFKNKPKAPPRKAAVAPTVNPSWVGANSPRDYTIAGTLKTKEPKKVKPSKPSKSYTLDDLD